MVRGIPSVITTEGAAVLTTAGGRDPSGSGRLGRVGEAVPSSGTTGKPRFDHLVVAPSIHVDRGPQ